MIPDAPDASGVDDARPMGGERDQIMEIATLILPGVATATTAACSTARAISRSPQIAHFELGYIPESAKELKAAAGSSSPTTRASISDAARAIRNGTSTRRSPASSTFLADRKSSRNLMPSFASSIAGHLHRAAVCPLQQSRIRSAVFGNSRQFSSCARTTARIWMTWARTSPCRVTQHAIMNYPLPDIKPARSIRRSPICTPTRPATSAARFTTSLRRRCLIAVRPAANISTTRPRTAPKSQHRRGHHRPPIHPNKPNAYEETMIQLSLCCSCVCSRAAPLYPHYTDVGWGGRRGHRRGSFQRQSLALWRRGGRRSAGEGLHYANGKLNNQSYQTGYDRAGAMPSNSNTGLRLLAAGKAGDEGRVRLYQVQLPEQVITG